MTTPGQADARPVKWLWPRDLVMLYTETLCAYQVVGEPRVEETTQGQVLENIECYQPPLERVCVNLWRLFFCRTILIVSWYSKDRLSSFHWGWTWTKSVWRLRCSFNDVRWNFLSPSLLSMPYSAAAVRWILCLFSDVFCWFVLQNLHAAMAKNLR